MAIYHLSAQVISRSAGRSAVAAAAYRAGDKLQDERLGQVYDFSRKQVADRLILAPADAPAWVQDREQLWNAVELAEKRKDAQLCRELNIALPRELTKEQQLQLVKDYCQEQFVDRGMVADLTIHRNDPQNPHAHVMLTTRTLTGEGFGPKNRDWNAKELLQTWREQWSVHANDALERAGIQERIDHRSFKDQGIEDRVPTIHEGPTVREMERRGAATDRGEMNRLAKEHNAVIIELEAYRQQKADLENRNRHLAPAERRVVAAAEKIMGRPATIESIGQHMEAQSARRKALQETEQRLQESLRPFETARSQYEVIEYCTGRMGRSNTLQRAFNKLERDMYRSLEKQIREAEAKLLQLGFKDREQFEARLAKVTAFNEKELAGIQQARSQLAAEQKLFLQADMTLKRAIVREVAAQYPIWPAGKYLNFKDAQAIKAVNDRVGKAVYPKELEAEVSKRQAKINELQRGIEAIDKTESRLHGAAQWLEKYELHSKEAGRLFQSPKRKAEQQQEAEKARRMMREFGIEGREDYSRQLADHRRALPEKPAMEASIAKMQPGFNLLQSALNGFKEANRQLQMERAKEQWKQRNRNVRHQGQEHDRER